MAEQFSFDVVSEVNMQEMKNVVDQATKEIKQRFDFKDSKTEITLKEKEKELIVVSDDEYKLNAVKDIIKTKCVKRGVSLKAFAYGTVEPALSGTVRQVAKIQSGIAAEKAKEMTKAIKESKLKVQAQIQGEQVRVLSKSKDELQVGHGISSEVKILGLICSSPTTARRDVKRPPASFSHRSDDLNVRRKYASVSSLAAASLDDLFEHPVRPRLVHG